MFMKLLLIFYLMKVTFGQYDVTDWSYLEIIDAMGQGLQIREGDVKESDVNLYLYSRENPNEPIRLEHHKNYSLNSKEGCKIVIHGFLENYRVNYLGEIKDEYLKLDDFNVILVDWKRVARSYYISAARNAFFIGEIIGTRIFEFKISSSNIHFIGFSLGAHIAAFAAKKIEKLSGTQIKRITALDPAGPYFRMERITENERLNAKDAKIVDVIHTDGGFLGYLMPIGTLDIYVNKGVRRQPGCRDGEPSLNRKQMIINAICSHRRASAYFVESIMMANITCFACDDYESMRGDGCNGNNTLIIVNQKITEYMQGICTFTTSDSEPYMAF